MIHLDEITQATPFERQNPIQSLAADPNEILKQLVRSRLKKPQRHRLLHGFPLAASMPFLNHETRHAVENGDSRFQHFYHPDKPLLVGVLPHSYCNLKIAGCGFCTFPHEDFSSLNGYRNGISPNNAHQFRTIIRSRRFVRLHLRIA